MKSFLTHFDLKSILPLIIGHFGTGVPLKSLGSYPTANLPPEIEEIHNEIQKRLIGGTGPAADRALSAYMALLSVDGCVEARLFSGVPITTAYSLKMGKTSSQSEEVAVGHDVECLSAFRDNYADYAGVDLSCFYLTKYSSITPKILRKPTWGIYLCQCWFVPDRDAFVAFAK